MNFCWRITKYAPKKRNLQGLFLEETWTSVSDIGKLYQRKELAYDEYIKIENLYIQAIVQFMTCLNISYLQIKNLENSDRISNVRFVNQQDIMFVNTIQEGDLLTLEQVMLASKLILREYFWCKLINDNKMFVHFGYDYYMYIGSFLPCSHALSTIQKNGLFVEPFESPYQ